MLKQIGDGSWSFGYEGKPWAWSSSVDDVFDVVVQPAQRPVGSFGEECLIAAREFVDAYQGEQIFVLYSGGHDSEAVLETLRLAKIPARPIIFVDKNGINQAELKYASEYLKNTDYSPIIEIFDFKDWIESQEAYELAKMSQAPYQVNTLYYRMLLKYRTKGVLLGGGDCAIQYVNGIWCCEENEMTYSHLKFNMAHDIRGNPGLFWHSNYTMIAYYKDPVFELGLKDGCEDVSTNYNSRLKSLVMQRNFGLRPRAKLRWHERLGDNYPDLIKYTRTWYFPRKQWLAEHLFEVETQ